MLLTEEQVMQYRRDGYLLLTSHLSTDEINVLKGELPAVFAEDSPARVLEKGTNVVRSVYGCHLRNPIFRSLSLLPRVAEPAMQLLQHSIYVYQFKINAKAAFAGDTWEWHQDYIFWYKEDGMPKAQAINVAVYLDEVTEFNGPMFLIPGSHRAGMIDTAAAEEVAEKAEDLSRYYGDKPAWISNLTATLKYSLPKHVVASLVEKHYIAAPKGPRGSVLLFDCNLVHSSPGNLSPFDRVIALVTYNRTDNVPTRLQRPEFLICRDSRPLTLVPDDALALTHQAVAHG